MGDVLKLDYYYGIEADQFSFYRVPRLLIKDPRFKDLSSDAKLLYGLMLDRMSMSRKNNWFDDNNRAYIYYKVEKIQEDLGCAKATAVKVLSELDNKKGIGLIERVRQGLGRPDMIYVKNFATLAESAGHTGGDESEPSEVQKIDFCEGEDYTSGGSKIELQQVQNIENIRDNANTHRGSKTELQEVQNTEPNYNENNYTKENYNNRINLSTETFVKPPKTIKMEVVPGDKMDMMDEATAYINLIKQNIEYDHVMNNEMGFDKRLYQEIFEIIVDVVLGKRKTIMIGNAEYPYEVVKSRFLKLNCGHIEYVIDKVTHNTGEIRNIRAYLIASLYNAPTTETTYFSQMVHHDMYGGGWQEKGII